MLLEPVYGKKWMISEIKFPFFYSGGGAGKVWELMKFTIIELVACYKC
jgi:hypothetical protein